MKKNKIIFAIFTSIILLIACEKDGGESQIGYSSNGAVPNIQKNSNLDSFIDLTKINNDSEISLGFSVDKAIGEINSMDIIGFYIKADGTIYKATLVDNVTTFPTNITINKNDLLNAFAELNSKEDFALGDQLKITAELTLKDGTVQKILNNDGTNNFSSNVATSNLYKVFQTYNVSCPSNLGGNYSVISSGSSTDTGPSPSENPISNFATNVVITDNGGGNYTVSDAFGGLYLLWYDIYGIVEGLSKGEFNDICGTISGSFPEPFGTDVIVTGNVNPDGTISIQWENGYGDKGSSVYTKIN